MRAYQAKIGNETIWLSAGSFSFSVMILAEDFISAAMRAHELCNSAKDALVKIPEVDADSVCITSLDQISSDVVGDSGRLRYEESLEQAIEKVLRRAEREHPKA